jgi:hypothetical protein
MEQSSVNEFEWSKQVRFLNCKILSFQMSMKLLMERLVMWQLRLVTKLSLIALSLL